MRGQRTDLSLSSQGKFVYAEDVVRTHNLQFVEPEFITEEIKWVLSIEET
jgi:hypothetical protein